MGWGSTINVEWWAIFILFSQDHAVGARFGASDGACVDPNVGPFLDKLFCSDTFTSMLGLGGGDADYPG